MLEFCDASAATATRRIPGGTQFSSKLHSAASVLASASRVVASLRLAIASLSFLCMTVGAEAQQITITGSRMTECEKAAYDGRAFCGESDWYMWLGRNYQRANSNSGQSVGAAAPQPAPAPERPPQNSTADSVQNSDPENCTANPVVIETGEKVKEEDDFSSFGLYGLSLTRTYRSARTTGQLFGPNWPSTLDPPNMSTSTSVGPAPSLQVTFPSGASYTFIRQPGGGGMSITTYSASGNAKSGSISYFPYSGGWYELTYNQQIYRFGPGGGLASTVGRQSSGETLLTYAMSQFGGTGLAKLASITNLVGQTVTFTWTGNRVGSMSFRVDSNDLT